MILDIIGLRRGDRLFKLMGTKREEKERYSDRIQYSRLRCFPYLPNVHIITLYDMIEERIKKEES